MKSSAQKIENELFERVPKLEACRADFHKAYGLLEQCFRQGGKLLVCGNGGSAADAEHIVGELMKGFKLARLIPAADRAALLGLFGEEGAAMANRLQQALPAIALTGHCALSTAFANDVSPEMVFAQQVYGYARPGDALLCISTSGNSGNIVRAAMAARAFGSSVIALTGESGGKLAGLCDVTVRVPAKETYLVQEYHLPLYHALCAMLEAGFFAD